MTAAAARMMQALLAPPRTGAVVQEALDALQLWIRQLVGCRDLLLDLSRLGPGARARGPLAVAEIRRVHDASTPDPDSLAHQHRGQLLDLLEQVAEVLWPSRDLSAAWDSDTIEAVAELCQSLRPPSVPCSVCANDCAAARAHRHQGQYIGDECCWDERLRLSE